MCSARTGFHEVDAPIVALARPQTMEMGIRSGGVARCGGVGSRRQGMAQEALRRRVGADEAEPRRASRVNREMPDSSTMPDLVLMQLECRVRSCRRCARASGHI